MPMRNRVLWRCRRGTQELDRLLSEYAEYLLSESSPEQINVFLEFLELEDSQLQHFLLGQTEPERFEFRVIVRQIHQQKRSVL